MKVIYFYHMPKCGGEYIKNHIINLSNTLNGKYINFNDLSTDKPIDKLNYRYFSTLKRIPQLDDELIFIHHHHGYPGILDAFNRINELKARLFSLDHEFFLFTSLRNPISQVKSKLNYLINTEQVSGLSINKLLRDETYQNGMYKYLLYNHPSRHPDDMSLSHENFNKCIGLFDKIFDLGNLSEMKKWLDKILGVNISLPSKKINVSKHHIIPSIQETKLLKEVNSLDFFFYNEVFKFEILEKTMTQFKFMLKAHEIEHRLKEIKRNG